MSLLRRSASVRHHHAVRRAALRAMFGMTLFAATGATPSHAHAAAGHAAPAAHVLHVAR